VGNRYSILGEFARGGMGKISRANDAEFDREVALKEMKPEFLCRLDFRHRFLREARVTGLLEHPGIVPVYSIGSEDHQPYYVMRLVSGESLTEAVKTFRLNYTSERNPVEFNLAFRRILNRFAAVCDTVRYAHSRGFIHRDIKPDNIRLGVFGETILLDWGLARRLEPDASDLSSSTDIATEPPSESSGTFAAMPEGGCAEPMLPGTVAHLAPPTDADDGPPGTSPGHGTVPSPGRTVARPAAPEIDLSYTSGDQVMGSPGFMSPEQASGHNDRVGIASDIWSLGATLYFILTGVSPVVGGTVRELVERTASGAAIVPPREIQPGIPAALETVCLRALAFRPIDRYQSVQALKTDIERWFSDEEEKQIALAGQKLASQQRELALKTLQTIIYEVDGVLRHIPGMRQTRHRLLEHAFSGLTELIACTDGAGQADREQIRVLLSLGEMLTNTRRGGTSEARPLYERAMAMAVEQLGRDPQNVSARRDMASVHNRMGELMLRTGETTGAIRELSAALSIRRDLAREEPDNETSRGQEGMSGGLLGDAWRRVGDLREAERCLQIAIGILGPMVRVNPDNLRFQTHLASTLDSLGRTTLRLGRIAEARQHTEMFLAICDQLLCRDPNNYRWRRERTIALINVGQVYLAADEPAKARESFEGAIAERSMLLEADPENLQSQRDMSVARNCLGLAFLKLGATESALECVRDAMELISPLARSDAGNSRLQRDLAFTWQRLGEIHVARGESEPASQALSEAMAIFDDLVHRDPDNAWLATETMDVCLTIARLEKSRGQAFEAANAVRWGLTIAAGCTRQVLLEPEIRALEAEMRTDERGTHQ